MGLGASRAAHEASRLGWAADPVVRVRDQSGLFLGSPGLRG